MKFKAVTQEHPMGCAIACVASLLGVSYKNHYGYSKKENAAKKGYYIKDIILALKKRKLRYKGSKVTNKTRKYLNKIGSIAFIKRSKRYPAGHYLLKTNKGWMNPWINYPEIAPAKSGFNKNLPGKAQWILYKV